MMDLKILPGFFSYVLFSRFNFSASKIVASKFENMIIEGYVKSLIRVIINVPRVFSVLPPRPPVSFLPPTTPFCLPHNLAFIYMSLANRCFYVSLKIQGSQMREMGNYLSLWDELDQLNVMIPVAFLRKWYDLVRYSVNFFPWHVKGTFPGPFLRLDTQADSLT